jgi:hypothetical protein
LVGGAAMKLEFKDIINKEAGKNAIVIGLGPSLDKHIEKIQKLSQDNNFIIIPFSSFNPMGTI